MNTQGIPSCEWPDAQHPATFRNCCDKDGRPDKNLERRAAEDRIEAITKQLDCPHGLMNKKRDALAPEAFQFTLVNNAMLPFANLQIAVDLARKCLQCRWVSWAG